MLKKLTWKEKYILSLSENMSLKDIMRLRDIGQPTAIKIRNKAIEYCIRNGIEFNTRLVPTEAVLIVTGHDIQYYYDKMVLESKTLS